MSVLGICMMNVRLNGEAIVGQSLPHCPFLTGNTGSDEEGVPVVSQSQAPFNRLLVRTGLILGLQFYSYKKERLLSKSK